MNQIDCASPGVTLRNAGCLCVVVFLLVMQEPRTECIVRHAPDK